MCNLSEVGSFALCIYWDFNTELSANKNVQTAQPVGVPLCISKQSWRAGKLSGRGGDGLKRPYDGK